MAGTSLNVFACWFGIVVIIGVLTMELQAAAIQSSGEAEGCMYKDVLRKKGEKFDDGCEYECECIDETTNKISCIGRCKQYGELPKNCQLKKEPDECCAEPVCTFPDGQTQAGLSNGCLHQDVLRQQGEKWDDGCDYVYECIDATDGRMRRSEKCQKYGELPSNCQLKTAPGECCAEPVCTFSDGQTQTGLTKGCLNDNVLRKQGEKFDHGCEYECECINENTGKISCIGRCKQYGELPSNCQLKKEPDECCAEPVCTFPDGQTQTGVTKGCVYKDVLRKLGEKFDDGCEYECECIDENKGKISCTGRCKQYGELPKNCKLKKEPDECCAEPVCTFPDGQTQTGLNGGCLYKQVFRRQGDKWADGCDYNCECVDGNKGQTKCTVKCISWKLPLICSLDPPAEGKCCSTPNCPASVKIQYPPGYVAE